jgi:hypothetical protein
MTSKPPEYPGPQVDPRHPSAVTGIIQAGGECGEGPGDRLAGAEVVAVVIVHHRPDDADVAGQVQAGHGGARASGGLVMPGRRLPGSFILALPEDQGYEESPGGAMLAGAGGAEGVSGPSGELSQGGRVRRCRGGVRQRGCRRRIGVRPCGRLSRRLVRRPCGCAGRRARLYCQVPGAGPSLADRAICTDPALSVARALTRTSTMAPSTRALTDRVAPAGCPGRARVVTMTAAPRSGAPRCRWPGFPTRRRR